MMTSVVICSLRDLFANTIAVDFIVVNKVDDQLSMIVDIIVVLIEQRNTSTYSASATI
jgi:hypothetical protein